MTPMIVDPDFSQWMTSLRRALHEIPETAFQETKTAALICDVLSRLKIPFQSKIAETGIVARLTGKRKGPTVVYRADMDALKIKELTGLPFASTHPENMHACGHDSHMTIALGIARRLVESGFEANGKGSVLFVFQPGEEGGGGAKVMLDTGVFDKDEISAAFAIHVQPELPVGHIGISKAAANAAVDHVTIKITGKGGHGAHPDQCRDPILPAAQILSQIQALINMETPASDPVVLTICQINAGTAFNVIPETLVMSGTLRTLSQVMREKMHSRLGELMGGMEKAMGVKAELLVDEGYPVLVNSGDLVAHVLKSAPAVMPKENIHIRPPSMGSEDFAFFCEKWGGILVEMGCRDPEVDFRHGLHSPYFTIHEDVLAFGAGLLEKILTDYLEAFPSD